MHKYKTPIQRAEDTAWKWFSLVVRVTDCLLTTGRTDYGACYTCGKRFPIEQLQAGHFVGGRRGAVLFQRRAVRAQCVECNKWMNGNYKSFYNQLLWDYGAKFVEQARAQKHQTKSWTEDELRSIAKFYRLYYHSLKNLSGQEVRELMS